MSSPSACPSFVIEHLASLLPQCSIRDCTPLLSAQQQVWILTFSTSNQPLPDHYARALVDGNSTLVVRLWKQGGTWWNLHSTRKNVERLARIEVKAYRRSRKALTSNSSNMVIPQVLYFSLDDDNESPSDKDTEKETPPWALMEYVGRTSAYFDDATRVWNSDWLDSMVKVRHEFGFEEPHPRWGRIPVEKCDAYVNMLLDQVIFPLVRYCYQHPTLDWRELGQSTQGHGSDGRNGYHRQKEKENSSHPIRYCDMVARYRAHLIRLLPETSSTSSTTTSSVSHQEEMEGVSQPCFLQRLVPVINRAVQTLQQHNISDLPPVLCHMDLQPQNLFFCRDTTGDTQICSVLDWEEAAHADPRFEVLLVCRKVCANLSQAQRVWERVTLEFSQQYQLEMGPMEPWLQLEAVHSVLTLALQSTRGGGGGKSPPTPILQGKMERELQRLVTLGMAFCQDALFVVCEN